MHRTLLIESLAILGAKYEDQVNAKKELHRHARELDSIGDKEAAERIYEELLQTDAENAQAWLELGLLRRSVGRSHLALDPILTALRIQPFNARIHHAFGFTLQSSPNPDDALRSYQRAIDVIANANDLKSVEAICRRTVRDSRKPAAYLTLGNVLIARHKVSHAIMAYTEAFRTNKAVDVARNLAYAHGLSRDRFRSPLFLAYAYFLDGRPAEALRRLEELPTKPYNDFYFCKVFILCYLHSRQYDRATQVYREAAVHHRDADQLALEIAAKLDAKGHISEAIALSAEALTAQPGNLSLKYLHHLTLPAVYEREEEIEFYRRRFSPMD